MGVGHIRAMDRTAVIGTSGKSCFVSKVVIRTYGAWVRCASGIGPVWIAHGSCMDRSWGLAWGIRVWIAGYF